MRSTCSSPPNSVVSWSATKAANSASSAASPISHSVRPRFGSAARGRRARGLEARISAPVSPVSSRKTATRSPARSKVTSQPKASSTICAKAASAVTNSGTKIASSTAASTAPRAPGPNRASRLSPPTRAVSTTTRARPGRKRATHASAPATTSRQLRRAGRRQRGERRGGEQRQHDDPLRRPQRRHERERRGGGPAGDPPRLARPRGEDGDHDDRERGDGDPEAGGPAGQQQRSEQRRPAGRGDETWHGHGVAGRSRTIRQPCGSRSSARMLPPCASTIQRAIARPRPVPPSRAERAWSVR